MAISTGAKLGAYEVLSLLGAGGMGEVYRARDPRLGRDVAIKVLPAERVLDENRRRRFLQEARAASALSHPNIITVHEIESVDGLDFIVMEYVPGRTLDGLIPKRGMRLPEVLRTAIPIADALARAHSRGIIHRDLKPANVAVTPEGIVKVLDFGLAKLLADDGTDEDAETRSDENSGPLSRPGAIAGTVPYMSPEQATGQKVDARSDVFSFGAVLFEMVTGRRAFAGRSKGETLAAVAKEQVRPPSTLVAGVPKELDRLILRCLQKDPERRFQHMGDVKVDLLEIEEEFESQPPAGSPRVNRRSLLVAGLAASLLLGAGAWLRWRPREAQPRSPQLSSLTSLRGSELNPFFSPDGEQIAFAWDGEKGDNTDVYLKRLDSSEVLRVTSDPADDAVPSWSPDGRQIAFLRMKPGDSANLRRLLDYPAAIHLVSPLGSSDRRLNDFPARHSQLSWSRDSRFLAAARFAQPTEQDPKDSAIFLIPMQGGAPRPITSPSPLTYHADPAFSRDGRQLAYLTCTHFLVCQVEVVELGLDYVPVGPPRRLTRRVGWLNGLAWGPDGNSLIYGDVTARRLWRAFVGGDRPPETLAVAGLSPVQPATVAGSDRLAFARIESNTDIYRFEVGRPPEPVLVSSFPERHPHLSPDGRRIAFASERAGDERQIWVADTDGSNPTQLTSGPGIWQGSPRWSPDGKKIAFDSQAEDGRWDIWTIESDGASLARITQDPGDEQNPTWSRDGRWIYFSSNRSGAPADIWRIPETGGSEERMTQGGGERADESANGRDLLFRRALANGSLLVRPLRGGLERAMRDCVPIQGIAIGSGGVYHVACGPEPSTRPLYLFDPATGKDRLLGNLDDAVGDLTVSADGKAILFTKRVGQGADLMLIESFR